MAPTPRPVADTAWPPKDELVHLNHDVRRIDGPEKVTGRAQYTHDVRVPGMLYGRVLLCPYPVAKPAIDLAPAKALPGVVAAILLEDNLRDGFTSRLGQPIAAVAAETPELAEDALRAIKVEYELGRWAIDREQSLASDAPQVGQKGNLSKGDSQGDRAAAEAALAECDATIEAVYTVPVQFHACLETHGVVVDYRGGDDATVYASTQHVHSIAGEAARELGLSGDKVRAITQHMGGGFGAKFGLRIPGMAACRLAKAAERPVHLMFTRSDECVSTGNRSGARTFVKAGAKKDGTLHALVAGVEKYGGVGGGSHARMPYIYSVTQAYGEIQSVLTHTDASNAMRAPGHPQASFAMESLVDELAHGIGMDPLAFRLKNLSDPVYHRQLERVAREIGWFEHPHRLGPAKELAERAVGIGFGIATWGTGGRKTCEVDVRIGQDGSVSSSVGTQDLGTGTRTYVASIVAEILGLEVREVTARIGDSRLGNANGSGGSSTVPHLTPAVLDAACKARDAFLEHLAPLLRVAASDLVAKGGAVFVAKDPQKKLSWREACATLPPAGLEKRGEFVEGLSGGGVHGAQAAKVEVDTLTGEVRVLKMVGIQDCGLAINRLAARSQVNGGMVQSLSYGLWEERVLDPALGLALNNNFEEYKIAGTLDIPEVVAILDDDDGRMQAIGIGEPPAIPGQSAIANAVFNACGVRIRSLPLSRDKVILGLAERS